MSVEDFRCTKDIDFNTVFENVHIYLITFLILTTMYY